MSCNNISNKSSASRRALFQKLCQDKKNTSLIQTSCHSFLADPLRNPMTGKKIAANKDVHGFFQQLCDTGRKASTTNTTTTTTPSKETINAQVALEELIEQKIENYLIALDHFNVQRWGQGSAPKGSKSPVDWFVSVRAIESHISRAYDQWVAEGNEPVREFVVQCMDPDSLKQHSSNNNNKEYVTDLYEEAQAFFNARDLMMTDDLDTIFKSVKDKHMAQKFAKIPSVHAERLKRQKFMHHVQEIERQFINEFKSEKGAKDAVWVRTELGSIVQKQTHKHAHAFADRVYNHILELAIEHNDLTMNQLEQGFKVARRHLFK